jgi:membrane protease YdiL (CAAX protease family)
VHILHDTIIKKEGKYMKKSSEKNELIITIFLIILYLLSNSISINIFGNNHFITAICNVLLSLFIISYIVKNKLMRYYRLNSFPDMKKFLYFIPLVIIMSVNLWNGIHINNTSIEIIIHIITMIAVGFLEEIIFRGFLFQMLSKDSIKLAIIITILTFGIGHILNLFNNAEIIPTLLQICYATATGYLFAIIVYKGNSLWPCIITHIVVNSLSIFSESTSLTYNCITSIILIITSILYTYYINRTIKNNNK